MIQHIKMFFVLNKVQYVTDYGVPYYHNTESNETMWELPVGQAAICSQTGQPVAQAASTPVQEEKKVEPVVEKKQARQEVKQQQEQGFVIK